jgi:Leucine-rich repeat (LRR) protein
LRPSKKWLFFLLLVASFSLVLSAAAQCVSAPSGLIGWWPSEGNANNMLGTNNGTLVGGATANALGYVGSTFTFDGTNGYVQVADSPILRPTNITIEAWVRFAGLDTPGTASAGEQYIVFKQNTRSGGFEGYSLSKTRIVGGDVFTFLATSAAGQLVEVRSTNFVTTNVWYHCAAVRGSNFVQMYVNGQLQSQAAITFPLDYGNFPLYFGTSGQSYWDRKLKGTLDEVSLYSRALSSNEISALYAAGVSGKCKLANITNQPLSQAVMLGGNATFTVGAGGFGTLGYQWRFSGTNIGGATATSYTRLNAQSPDAGSYSVVVTNPGGAVTSAVATLVVNIPPSISTPPQNLTVNQGQNAGFSVIAGGTGPLSYQWRFSGTNINGATASSYTRVSAQPADIGNYVVIVTNVAGAVTSSIATLSVNIPPSIPGPPQNATVTQGQDATFNVTASGTAPLAYQWRFNGVNIGGAIGSSYTRVSAQSADAGNYTVVVSNMAGTVTSVVASLIVNVPPGISVPPQNLTVIQNQNAAFSVTATGTAPLSYQWRFNGTNISGAVSSSYTRLSAQPADAGNYAVVVSNVAGAITSAVAALTVNVPPSISAPPQSLTVNQDQNALFSVTAAGTAPLSYQWRFNNVDIPGATDSDYTRLSAQASHAGNYTVVVTNVAGAITSAVASLSVNIPPAVSVPPGSQTVNQGQNAAFSVIATGTGPLSYQWRFNGSDILGATASDYTRFNAQGSDAGGYSVVIINMAGSVTSVVASLSVNIPPGISVPPQNLTVNQGQNAGFNVTATGTGPLNYQWRFNGTDISGATASDYTRTSAQSTDVGNYEVVVVNVAGSITSAVATLSVNLPPGISVPPQNLTVNQGQNAGFSITATGTGPLSYQWRFNGADISGATTTDFTRTNAQASDAGAYTVVVTNVAGAITSSVATLNVNIPPGVAVPPQSVAVNQGQPAGFSVTATGTMPLSYQWRLNGNNIIGATDSDYFRFSVQPPDVGNYTVVIGNMAGAITSAVATLSLNVPPSILEPPQTLTVNQGENASFSVIAAGTTPLSYQWCFNGASISGATASDYTRFNAQPAHAGAYTVVVTNVAGAITSSVAALTVGYPPGISVPPQNLTVNQGQNAGFSVTATGSVPLSYQWRFNGTNIAGATLSEYTRVSAQLTDGGGYSVVVGNVAGSTTSAVAILTVNGPPTITGQPADLTVIENQDAIFSVIATGTAPLSYQWWFSGTDIGGANFSTYVRTNAQAADAGPYSVVISNVAGVVTSAVVSLSVNIPPGILIPPQSQTVLQNQDATFFVVAKGTSPRSYQWRFNGANIAGATASMYVRSGAQTIDAGGYSVVITNVAGTATSAVATLTVNVPPGISIPPQNLTVFQNQDANFTVTANGTSPLSYQWLFGGVNIVGATTSSYTRVASQPGDAGGYSVVVTNVAGAITSAVANLVVNNAPNITSQPQSRTNIVGTLATFNVTASGSQLGYQWRFNGAFIPAATGTSLSLPGVQTTNAGNYSVVVTNFAGSATSSVASLTILVPVNISGQPQNRTNAPGTMTSFNVNASGTPTLKYQWRFNGGNLVGATTSGYVISNVQLGDAGNYSVVVTNLAGAVTSAVATLTVPFNTTNFIPDPNLSNAVYMALGKSSGPLSILDLTTLTNLYADNRYITNLTGLGLATNLTGLSVSANFISDLHPLQNMRQLRVLELDKNPILFHSPLGLLTNLTSLVLGGNPISDYSIFSSLLQLTNLSLPRSSVASLTPFQPLFQLRSLTITEEAVNDLTPISGLTNLTQLDIRQNPITNHALLAGLTNLTKLCLGWSPVLTDLTFVQSLRQLTWLDFGYSAVQNLAPVAGLTNLTYLVVSGNPVTNYSVLSNLTKLVNLELHDSSVTNSSFITNLTRLAYADLYRGITNPPVWSGLTNLRSIVLAGVSDYSGLTNLSLTNLWLCENGVSNAIILTNLTQLRNLILDDNRISDAQPLKALTNLVGLSLNRNNGLSYASLSGFTNLTSLWLDGGAVSNLNLLGGLPRLQFLSLRTNVLTTLSGLEGLSNLTSVYIERNRLTNLWHLTNLSRLRFAGQAGNLQDLTEGSPALSVINELRGWGPLIPGRGVQVGPVQQNKAPSVTISTNVFILVDGSASVNFTVSDDDTPVNQLIVTANSLNPGLVPGANLIFSGTNSSRTLSITPLAGLTGTALITLSATDSVGASNVVSLQVNVLPAASVTNICPGADSNLLAAIGLEANKTASLLTTVDLLRLSRLSVNGAILADPCVWPWLTNLNELYLGGDSINSLEFLSNLTRLKTLGLYNNNVADLSSLAYLTNLITLDLNGNSISNLTFLQTLTSLQSLTLDNNKVVDLSPLIGLTNLATLSIARNLLVEIDTLAFLPRLSYVDLTMNLLDINGNSLAVAIIDFLKSVGVVVVYSPQREPPVIDVRTSWVVNANTTSTVSFTIVDLASSGQFRVGGVASNPGLFPAVSAFMITNGSGVLMVTPAVNQASGTALVTLNATNDVGLHSSVGIVVTLTTFLPVDGSLLNSSNLSWTTSGNSPWFGQTLVTHDSVSAAQSGPIGNLQSSWLQTSILGPGQLTYWCKISSETNYDFLQFYLNDVLVSNAISGEVDWHQEKLTLPPGIQTVRWVYSHDKDTSLGADAAWVDEVSFDFRSWIELAKDPVPSPVQLKLHLSPGENYEIHYSTNLTDWWLLNSILATNTEMLIFDTDLTPPRRFYRLRGLGPP